MKSPNAKKLAGILFALNWQGHVELPDADLLWLANELAGALNGTRKGRCEACGHPAEVIVPTPMGNACETCIEQFGHMAQEQRRMLE